MTPFPSKNNCTFCKNLLPKKDGWRACCSAFPDGIPNDYCFERIDISKLDECANGYKYDPDPEKRRMYGYSD